MNTDADDRVCFIGVHRCKNRPPDRGKTPGKSGG
jgi:hypothetical protein